MIPSPEIKPTLADEPVGASNCTLATDVILRASAASRKDFGLKGLDVFLNSIRFSSTPSFKKTILSFLESKNDFTSRSIAKILAAILSYFLSLIPEICLTS